MAELSGLFNRGKRKLQLFGRIKRLNKLIAAHTVPEDKKKPIIFFNASARLEGLNLNAAFGIDRINELNRIRSGDVRYDMQHTKNQ